MSKEALICPRPVRSRAAPIRLSARAERSSMSLAGPAAAVLMVLCCLAGPILIDAAATLTAGAVFGLGAGAVVLLGLCLLLARWVRSR
jgi:hypothetical protein